MTKKELERALMNGYSLESSIQFQYGVGATIYKNPMDYDELDVFPDDEICYIPDTEIYGIPYGESNLSQDEIEHILKMCYTHDDFADVCRGDLKKARIIYTLCDFRNPADEYEEMKSINWNDDDEQSLH